MSTFIVRRTAPPAADLPVNPLLQRIYAVRGVRSADELQRELRLLTPPDALLGMEKAVELLYAALRERWRILIVADFDADGATSCALALRALRAMGAAWVGYRLAEILPMPSAEKQSCLELADPVERLRVLRPMLRPFRHERGQ